MTWLLLASVSFAQAQPARLLTPADAVALAAADAARLPAAAARRCRWLWLGDGDAKAKQELWQVLSVWCNVLSREPDLVRPAVVVSDGKVVDGLAVPPVDWIGAILLRLDLADYRWSAQVWDSMQEDDPYFHAFLSVETVTGEETVIIRQKQRWPGGVWRVQDGGDGKNWPAGEYDVDVPVKRPKKAVTKQVVLAPWLANDAIGKLALSRLVEYTGCSAPVFRADWFLWEVGVQADRKVGFYGLIEVKDRASFQKIVGFDQKLSEAFTRELLASVANSGVAQQPRRIARFEKIGGAYWSTFDNRQATDKRNPLRVLNGGFEHDAEEVFSHGANGLWKVGLFAADGTRQDSAPDFVGFDKTSHNNDGRIHVGLSCFRCHQGAKGSDGLNDIKDWSRTLFKPPLALTSVDYAQLKKLRQSYLRRLEPFMQGDRARHGDSVRECCGLDPAGFASALASCWAAYDSPVDTVRAAVDLGISEERLRAAALVYMRQAGQTDTVIGMFARPREDFIPLPLTTWHESYGQVQTLLRSVIP